MFDLVKLEYLARTGSNHAPLLLFCENLSTSILRPFRFLNFWIEKAYFQQVMRENWRSNKYIFFSLNQKPKNTNNSLFSRSKERFRDILKELITREEIVRL